MNFKLNSALRALSLSTLSALQHKVNLSNRTLRLICETGLVCFEGLVKIPFLVALRVSKFWATVNCR